MARLHVRAVGTGTEGDPFRVLLPTYSLVEFDETTGDAIVEVPDADVPAIVRAAAKRNQRVRGKDFQVLSPTQPERQALQQRIRARYVEGYSQFDADSVVM